MNKQNIAPLITTQSIIPLFFKKYIFGDQITEKSKVSSCKDDHLLAIKGFIESKKYQKIDKKDPLDQELIALFKRMQNNSNAENNKEISNELLSIFKIYLTLRTIRQMIHRIKIGQTPRILDEIKNILIKDFEDILNLYPEYKAAIIYIASTI